MRYAQVRPHGVTSFDLMSLLMRLCKHRYLTRTRPETGLQRPFEQRRAGCKLLLRRICVCESMSRSLWLERQSVNDSKNDSCEVFKQNGFAGHRKKKKRECHMSTGQQACEWRFHKHFSSTKNNIRGSESRFFFCLLFCAARIPLPVAAASPAATTDAVAAAG